MPSQTPPSGTFAGRYTIERELGRGGTATVYLANDTTTSTSVALKVLHRELVESVAADRFLREFRMNAGLRHPHVAPILNSGQFGADLFLVMPHMESGSLRTRLDKERQLSVDHVVEIVRAIGSALQHAHERGLIHRDVKPENILFSGDQAYLSDFGIARAVERAAGDSTTSSGIVRGTPAYMSPEQASGDHQFDGRSDQYSFACVVYEMLAGLPAFHGPTHESTIALRFKHAPREISVYRPGISPAIERVIQKALSLSPADRYSNMSEFVKAFDAAVIAPSRAAGGGLPSLKGFQPTIAIAAAATLVIALGIFGVTRSWLAGRRAIADTTQVVVLPVETADATPANGTAPFELFYTALRRWQDLHVIAIDRTIDALRRRPAGRLTLEDMNQLATSLGARRYVLVKPTRTPTGNAVFAEYRDVIAGQLHPAQLDLPTEASRVAATYAALADSIVLRGASDGGLPGTAGPRHLFATQAFIRAASARREWDLARADSELALAVSLDSAFSRAYVWQAQQKSWQNLDSQRWVALADGALLDTTSLTPTERSMAHALAMMGRSQYPEACGIYRTLVRADSGSFVGWYGLGDCNEKDHIVVPDSHSPSRWSFRSSMQQAVVSYVRAFQVIPATYRGFQKQGYNRLRELLFMSGNRWREGWPAGDPSQVFYGIPTLSSDTIALTPQPAAAVASHRVSDSSPTPIVIRLRTVFDSIVTRWASAFPNSPAMKEAVAVSLEIRGDPASTDTIEAAERLSPERGDRIRLAATRIAMRLKFAAVSGSASSLDQVLTSADSLLDKNSATATPEIAGYLAPISAMTGRCRQTAGMLRKYVAGSSSSPLPSDVAADIAELGAFFSVGCQPQDAHARLDAIAKSIASALPSASAERQTYMQLNGIVRAIFPIDSAWTARFAGTAPTLAAELAVAQGRPDLARASLVALARGHDAALPGRVTADAVLPEAKVWLTLGDTADAIASLETALGPARFTTPLATNEPSYNVGRLGFLIQAYCLSAQLLANRDRPKARQRAQVALSMWREADPELRPMLSILRDIAK